jgi:hypothetical protein
MNSKLTTTVAAVSLCVAIGFAAVCQSPQVHLQKDEAWASKAVTPAEMQRRIEAAASQYKQYAPIPRIAFFDIAYPADATEYADLDGHAVLLITALCQDPAELPLKRVFVLADGQEHDLKVVASVRSKQPNSNEQVAKTFGLYRVDSIYLLPLSLRMKKSELLMDFAEHRTGFRATEFVPTDVPPTVSSLPIRPPSGSGPSEQSLIRFLQREYPGFIRTE